MKNKLLFLLLLIVLFLVSCNQDQPKVNWEISPILTPPAEYTPNFITSVIQYSLPLLDYGYVDDAVKLSSLLDDFYHEINGSEVANEGPFSWKQTAITMIGAYLNNICWDGALNGQSEIVIETCHNAVELEPSIGANRDSRGIALAQLGEEYFEMAAKDFEFFVNWYWSLSDNERDLFGLSDVLVAHRIGWIALLEEGINPIDGIELQRLREEESFSHKDSVNFRNEEVYYWIAFDSLLYFEHYFDVFEVISQLAMFENADVSYYWHQVCINGSIRGHAEDVMVACEKAIETSDDNGKYYDGRGLARALTSNYTEAILDFLAAKVYLANQTDDQWVYYYQITVSDYDRWIEGLKNDEIPFTQNDIDNLAYPFLVMTFEVDEDEQVTIVDEGVTTVAVPSIDDASVTPTATITPIPDAVSIPTITPTNIIVPTFTSTPIPSPTKSPVPIKLDCILTVTNLLTWKQHLFKDNVHLMPIGDGKTNSVQIKCGTYRFQYCSESDQTNCGNSFNGTIYDDTQWTVGP
jgi:hypothetical protein